MTSVNQSALIAPIRGRNVYELENESEVEQNGVVEEVKILSILWKNGKMGAAYFNFSEKLLYIYEEVLELSSPFLVTSTLYREIMPKFLITIGNADDEYVKYLIDTVLERNDSTTTNSLRSLPPNMFLLPLKEYSFETCKSILSLLNLASNPEATEVEKELYINSVINFDYKLSVHTAGALVKYLDKNWVYFTAAREDVHYLHALQVSLRGHLLMDRTTISALQIFNQCSHDASFKRGLQSSAHEGLSVFKLYSSSCSSKLGLTCLRNLLLTPMNDIDELNKRLDFLSFVLHPAHQSFIGSLHDNLKNFGDITNILSRINHSRANRREWSTLYKAIYYTIYIRELSAPYINSCELLREFHDSITMELMALENSINNAIDFSNKNTYGRPVIKLGLDESLDAKKLRLEDIAQHVTAAASLAAKQLPDFLHECAIVYLPEMGHLIAIKEWAPNCNPEDLSDLGYRFMFTLRGTIHYKSPMCSELDESLGDITAEIISHENRIMQRLSNFVLKYNKDIREPLKLLSKIDALMAIAKTSAQNNYVRPKLNTENVFEIEDCRHALLELVSNIEPNSFFSGQQYSHIKIVTGPNGSGKSIYLKQIALIIYMAHVGSYVPAKAANICMLHSMHSRMQATESVCVRLSSFMIDATQATQAVLCQEPNSLILLDEFGKGTLDGDALALLTGVLSLLRGRGSNCPHIMVSTHHQTLSKHLPQGPLVDHLKMAHSEEDGVFLFLYKVVEGVSTSFAFNIALQVGLDEDIITRARDLFEGRNRNDDRGRNQNDVNVTVNDDVLKDLLSIEIPEPDIDN